jgi:type IV pilus assembly protein PilN
MSVIQQLQESRPEIVHLFDELVVTMPDGLVLSKIVQYGDTVTLEGRAQSNATISALMRNIEASAWLGQTLLKVIESKDKTTTGLNQFQLQLQQIKPDSQKENNQSTTS